MAYWSVYAAELMGIFYAISLVLKMAHRGWEATIRDRKPATILCDNMLVL
jgi:hypothetical protein